MPVFEKFSVPENFTLHDNKTMNVDILIREVEIDWTRFLLNWKFTKNPPVPWSYNLVNFPQRIAVYNILINFLKHMRFHLPGAHNDILLNLNLRPIFEKKAPNL